MKKQVGIKSQAQAKRLYAEYKKGSISYEDMMKSVHATTDMKKLPQRIGRPRTVDKKTALAIKGLV